MRRADEVARRAAGPPAPTPQVPAASGGVARRGEAGMLSLEAVMMLPVLALLIMALIETAVVIRDVLVAHEAARAGARAAATTSGADPVVAAARRAAPEMTVDVEVSPTVRRDGDIATVTVRSRRSVGPVTHTITARAVSRVEPAVGTTARSEPP